MNNLSNTKLCLANGLLIVKTVIIFCLTKKAFMQNTS